MKYGLDQEQRQTLATITILGAATYAVMKPPETFSANVVDMITVSGYAIAAEYTRQGCMHLGQLCDSSYRNRRGLLIGFALYAGIIYSPVPQIALKFTKNTIRPFVSLGMKFVDNAAEKIDAEKNSIIGHNHNKHRFH